MHGNGIMPDIRGRFQKRFGVPEAVKSFSSMEGVFSLLNRERSDGPSWQDWTVVAVECV